MNSHDASCFSGVLLKTATFAPNCTVFAFEGSDWGRLAMLQWKPAVLSARSFMNGTVDVEERKNVSFPAARSFWESNPAGLYAQPSFTPRSYICRTWSPCAPFHATVLLSAAIRVPPREYTCALKYDASVLRANPL